MLTLPIKRKWFDMILSGVKKEEYRALTRRYCMMFRNAMDDDGIVHCRLRNGYSAHSPSITISARLSVGRGNPEWGASEADECFILSIISFQTDDT